MDMHQPSIKSPFMLEMERILGKPVAAETKLERLEGQLIQLEKRRTDRISKGRTQGGSAGALNRDVEAISFAIARKQQQINNLKNPLPV